MKNSRIYKEVNTYNEFRTGQKVRSKITGRPLGIITQILLMSRVGALVVIYDPRYRCEYRVNECFITPT